MRRPMLTGNLGVISMAISRSWRRRLGSVRSRRRNRTPGGEEGSFTVGSYVESCQWLAILWVGREVGRNGQRKM